MDPEKVSNEERSGQALLESLICLGITTAMLSGAFWALRAEWMRFRCLHLLFETTRSSLEGRTRGTANLGTWNVWISEESLAIEGRIRCAGRTERLRLLKLDPRQDR